MSKLIRALSGETASMIAIAIGATLGGLLEWAIVMKVISYLLS